MKKVKKSKIGKKLICTKTVGGLLAVVLLLTVALLFIPNTVKASGLIGFVQDVKYGYSTYALENYDLDFYVDTSWSWLPWNWMDGIGRTVMFGLYSLTNVIWGLSRYISFGTGEIVSEAYSLDLVSSMSDSIGENMQRLAGLTEKGFSAKGFYPGFMMLILLTVGAYVAYVGLVKREVSKAIQAVVSMVVIFIVSSAFILYAPTCIKSLNEFSSDVSTAALDLGTGFVMPGAEEKDEDTDSVALIRDALFNIQVYQPWLLMQYGTTDIDAIGAERVTNLLSVSPETEYGETREAVVKTEIETYANARMSVTKVTARLGEVIFIFFIDLAISAFVILLSGIMIMSQILFIVFVTFLPICFVIAMFPTQGGLAQKAVIRVANAIMMRAGITLVITTAFTISTMIYSISGEYSFLLIGFLQVAVFATVFFNLSDILEMMSLKQTDDGRGMMRKMMGTMFIRDAMSEGRRERRQKRRERKGKVTGAFKDANREVLHDVGAAARNRMDRSLSGLRGTDRESVARKKRAAERERRRSELDYSAAEKSSEIVSAKFSHNASSSELYDTYYERVDGHDLKRKNKPSYRISKNAPDVDSSKFKTESQKGENDKSRNLERHDRRTPGKTVREKYYGRKPQDKTVDAPGVGGDTEISLSEHETQKRPVNRKGVADVRRAQFSGDKTGLDKYKDLQQSRLQTGKGGQEVIERGKQRETGKTGTERTVGNIRERTVTSRTERTQVSGNRMEVQKLIEPAHKSTAGQGDFSRDYSSLMSERAAIQEGKMRSVSNRAPENRNSKRKNENRNTGRTKK